MFLWDLDDGGFAGVVLLKKGESSESFYCPARIAANVTLHLFRMIKS